jgi:uncharacterized protein
MNRWFIFIALFLSVYGLAHLYLLIKIRRAFYLGGVHYVLLFAILTFLFLAPVNARLIEGEGHQWAAVALSWIGFTWLGFVFLFVCQALIVDGYHLIVRAAQQVCAADWTAIMLSKRQCLNLLTLSTCAIMVYGAFEAYHIETERVTIRSHKIPAASGPVRIVQISDLHIGPLCFPARLAPVIKAVQAAKPDILVSTGDLIDGRGLRPQALAAALQSLPAPLGKFAVTGNHEFYAGISLASEFTHKAGFTLLRNQSVAVTKDIVIAGVDDPASHDPELKTKEQELLKSVPQNRFSLLLKHQPRIDADDVAHIDLQLSGHTHKGQIFPFDLLVRLRYPLGYGLRSIAPDRYLYTSRGTGTWGPPIRVLAPPEITIIDIVPADSGADGK